MRGSRLVAIAGLVAVLFALAVSIAQAQNNTNNTNNTNNSNNSGNSSGNGSLANAPAGVLISPSGVLTVKPFTDTTGDLTRMRINESRARIGAAVAKGSPLRKISLQRLEAALAELLAGGKQPTDEMKALAGRTRLQYGFY